LSFEPNKGQFDSRFTFGTRGLRSDLLINASTVKLRVQGSKDSRAATLDMSLDGANDRAIVRGGEPLPGYANYFHGDSQNWITHVPTFQSVFVENAYSGIDVVYYGNQSRLEYDFVIRPNGSPKSIALAFPNSNRVAVDSNGDLVIHAGDQEFRQSKPIVYQEVDGRRVSVDAAYVVHEHNRVAFQVGRYDKSRNLIIDPQLVYSTFSVTRLYGIATDSAGNAYLCGADAADLYADIGYTDAVVFKLNAAGTARLWSASFGTQEANDSATAIAVDASGNAFVTGFTNASLPPFIFPTTKNAIQPNRPGASDAFVTEFDTNGNLVYSTYLGGSGGERGDGIAIDSLGNIYVAGQTTSSDFPTAKAYQSTLRGSGDAFVTVLNPQSSAFIYSTYIGGSGSDAATAIAVDATGSAYLTGWTNSTDFPTRNPIRPTEAGGFDTFILKLNPAGSALIYGTYTGGSGDDIPTGIAIDSSNNAYVSGRTNSPNFPTVAAFQSALHGGFDAFVTKVNATGTAFTYSTYLGGSSDETVGGGWCGEKPTCGGITVNSSGNAYVTGITASPDFPQLLSMQNFNGITDAFVTEMSIDGSSLVYSTLLGGGTVIPEAGGPNNSGSAVAYRDGNLYLAGLTNASDFPTTDGSGCHLTPLDLACVNPSWNGNSAFIAKLADDQPSSTWTRVEQNGNPIQYSGSWSTNTNSNESGGSAALTLDGSATLTFTGTAARWIGFTDPWSGIANVYVDGVLKATVDTYSSATKYQVVQYTVTGLASGTHTLKIQATGQHNSAASAAWIWVDAFDFLATAGTGNPADFSLSITPNTATVLQGGNTSYTVSATPTNGFSGTISLSASGFGTGASGSFNPASFGGNGASTLLVNTTGNAATGAYTISVTGTSGTISHSVTVPFNVNSAVGTTTWSRVEQSNANIQYTGTWNSNNNANESGGSAYLTLDGSATFTFSGTGARWIGFSDPWSGIANVFVDGSQYGSVDTYSSGTKYQAVQYTITGLSSGTHTLKIQATGQHSPAASASWIWLDAFDFTAGGGVATPDFNLTATGSGTINPGGSTTYSVTIAPVGGFNSTVSLSASGFGTGASGSFSPSTITGSGSATLTVTTTGNAQTGSFNLMITASGGGIIHSATVPLTVNSTATPTWTRIEQTNSAIQYSGQWNTNTNSNESGGSAYLALNGSATLSFSGTGVRWIGFSDPWSGIANVYIDGVLKTQVDTFSTATKYQVVQYTITGLAPGSHTIRIEVTGQQNPSASAAWIWLDGFDVAN
jgi:hypothetical protein